MTRGRKPNPANVVALRGNAGKRSTPKENVNVDCPKKAPAAPTYLKDIARKEWRRIAPELVKNGILSILDYPILEAYCTAYADMVDAQKAIDDDGRYYESETKDGSKIKRKHPAVADLSESIKLLRSLGSELGLTPASRSRVSGSKKDEGSALGKFLNNGKKKK
jgi:P27 family predicted phage terminase small subunit